MQVPALVDPTALPYLTLDQLSDALRPLWEDATVLFEVLLNRPVFSWNEHIEMAQRAISTMDDSSKARLLLAHPRIGTDRATLKGRSTLSYLEQGGADALEKNVSRRLSDLNDQYEAKFGFPFVEFVAGRPKAAIIDVLAQRLESNKEFELSAGCDALVAIARDRLLRLSNIDNRQ